ncbi:MAG: FtsX-like permease family protein [Rhodobacter sp.]|nr:FtsX-like permease family protein [Rhodobacter sp.]MCY4168027.1 FtsX-like permease family protein [Rhodobacter sp.]MCY4242232.1 FtsX-like permease family protein [Rhodobacter sp.]
MRLPVAFSIARRELRGGVRGFRVLIACLALGVAAVAAVGHVRHSIEAGLRQEGAKLLGGDAEIQLSYRFATAAERGWMEANSVTVSEIVDFRSMAVVHGDGGSERGLTQVKGVDDAYPVFGTVLLESELTLDEALNGSRGLPGSVMDPVLIDRLGLEIGESFRLGTQEFILSAALLREPDGISGGFGLGPRTIVSTEALARSGLLQPGTLFSASYRLGVSAGDELAELETEATEIFDGGLRWRDTRNAAPGVSEFVNRLGAFLVLVGLAGLVVGGVGVAAAVRSYLDEKINVIATLKTVGAETRTIFMAYGLQTATLTLIGVALGLGVGTAAASLLLAFAGNLLPLPVVRSFHVAPMVEATVYGTLAAALFTLWPLSRIERVRAAALFRSRISPGTNLPGWRYLTALAIVLATLVTTSMALSGFPLLAMWSFAGLAGAFFALLSVAAGLRLVARRVARIRLARRFGALRRALGSIGGAGGEADPVVLSLGLGLSVLAAIGQIDSNLRHAIVQELPEIAPSYFVVDIQTDQLGDFVDGLRRDDEVHRVETAPMLRGVITRINGRPADTVAGDHWTLRGDRGITYSAAPPEGATITAGSWWPEDYIGPPQISFASEEAAELGLVIGDRLTLNVLGREIEAEITSFREVDFSSAGIGFVLSMNPAALAGAPHSHIATIYAEESAEARLLRETGRAYPNITMIRVRDAISRMGEVLDGIAAATSYGALVSLLTGLVVLVGAAAAGERARRFEAAVLKTVGASRLTVLLEFALRSSLFGLTAGVVAVGAGAAAGWGVMAFVMESGFSFDPLSALVIVLGGAFTTLLAGLLFAWRPLSARPAHVLRTGE